MKKLLALVLSVIMAASLAVPAFASPGLSPEEAASIGIIGGQDGPTAIIVSGPLGGFDPEDVDWGSLEERLNNWRDEIKKEMGGVPGQVGVMVDGKYVKFPDTVPEMNGGTTMVPVRALMEALGGEVEFAGGRVVCKTDEIRLTFTLGSAEALVEYPGGELMSDGQIFPLGSAPYLKGGRAYVPLRFLAEALGYEVGWDGEFETAILLDRAALAADIDKDFTILNKVQANRLPELKEGQSLQTEAKGKVSVTVFDTLNGSKTYSADLSAKQLMNEEAASGSMSVGLPEALLDLLKEQAGMDEEADEAVQLVVDLLKDLEYILDADGKMFFHSDALDRLADEENVWLGVDISEALAEMGQAGLVVSLADANEITIGSTLARMMPCESVSEWGSVMEMVDMLDSLYGDGKFTTSGGVSTLTIGVDDLFDLYKDMGLDEEDIAEAKAAFKEYKITMKVDSKGGAVMTCAMETNPQSGVPGMKIAMDVTQSGGNVSMTMSYHIANMGEMKLTLTQTQKTTSGKPMTQPPKGATILDTDAPELLNP